MADQRHDSGDPAEEASFGGRLERFFSECAETILERVGPGRARCIFLCGSFAGGEGSVAFTDGSPLFLSDVDLVLTVDTKEAHADIYPVRRGIASACEARFPEARFAGRVDIGVLLSSELGSLVPSPGVFDMRRLGRVLYGDPSVLELLPEPDAAAIGADAARLLCENRIASLLAAAVEPEESPRADQLPFLYALARVYTDIATAALCTAGAYRSGYGERLRWLRGDPGAEPVREALGPLLIERIAGWTAYKLRPVRAAGTSGDRSESWLDAAADILSAWRMATASLVGLYGDASASRSTQELIALRPRRGTLRTGLIGWKDFVMRQVGVSPFRALAAASAHLRDGTPENVVREEAVRLLDLAVRGGMRSRAGRPPGGFPHRGGSLIEAALETSRAWKQLVYGGEE